VAEEEDYFTWIPHFQATLQWPKDGTRPAFSCHHHLYRPECRVAEHMHYTDDEKIIFLIALNRWIAINPDAYFQFIVNFNSY